jgi:hypothetical protein
MKRKMRANNFYPSFIMARNCRLFLRKMIKKTIAKKNSGETMSVAHTNDSR